MKTLKTLYGVAIVVSILLGFVVKHEHGVFPWHGVPSIDSAFGILGALLLLLGVKGLETIAFRKENFYD